MITADVLDRAKLIVWDLDDTLWTGTLTEEGARFRPDIRHVVNELSRHGIVNSIASNNPHQLAREFLERHHCWRQFVFSEIHNGAKPEMVRQIIAHTQLRPANVIFLDDKPRLREAVKDAIPGLLATTTADDFCAAFATWAANRQYVDVNLERLERYRLLERRSVAQRAYVGDGLGTLHDFLRKSSVKCTSLSLTPQLETRVHELVHRANQLNFTRAPLDLAALQAMAHNPDIEARALHVEDRFGDYGICGFYALHRRPEPRITHFVFSCRILNMGVESAVYRRLGEPAIECARDKESDFSYVIRLAGEVDWVQFGESLEPAQPDPAPARGSSRAASLVLVGPCELMQLSLGLDKWFAQTIATNPKLMFLNDQGRVISHFGHHAFIDLALKPGLAEKHRETLAALPWFDAKLLDVDFLEPSVEGVCVLSAVRNAQCADYVHTSGEFSVPIDYFRAGGLDFTRRDNWPAAAEFMRWYHGSCPDGFLEWFSANFEFRGTVSKSTFMTTMTSLVGRLPLGLRLVILNTLDVPAVDVQTENTALVEQWKEQHALINGAIDQLAATYPDRVTLVNVNQYVRGPHDLITSSTGRTFFDLFTPFYHYDRRTIVHLGLRVIRILQETGTLTIEPAMMSSIESMALSSDADEFLVASSR